MKDLVKFNAPRGILLILIGLVAIYYINASYVSEYLDENKAKMPKIHLMLVEKALTKHNMNESYDEVNLAIKSMTEVEQYTDSIANLYIDKAINELVLLRREILKDTVYLEDFNHAFYETLNAMAYANLRLSELEIEKGNLSSAQRFVKTSFVYLKKSLKYSDESKVNKEEKVIDEIREIMKSLKYENNIQELDFEKVNKEMEALLEN